MRLAYGPEHHLQVIEGFLRLRLVQVLGELEAAFAKVVVQRAVEHLVREKRSWLFHVLELHSRLPVQRGKRRHLAVVPGVVDQERVRLQPVAVAVEMLRSYALVANYLQGFVASLNDRRYKCLV